jgi:2'-5' RNA ligase
MKYSLACLLEGPAAEYQQRLVREIADRFDLRFTLEQAIPPHFTLKYHFETEEIDTVEQIVSRFCTTHAKKAVEIGGFGEFAPDVAFLKVQLSPAAQTTFEAFLVELRHIPWMSFPRDPGGAMRAEAARGERVPAGPGEVVLLLAR